GGIEANARLPSSLQRAFESASTVGSSMVLVDAQDEAARLLRRTASSGCRILCASFCRCDKPVRRLNDDVSALTNKAGEANPRRRPAFGKQAHPIRRRLIERGSTLAGDGSFPRLLGLAYAESSREPATARFLLLPPCFPGIPDQGGEAGNGSDGPF